MIKYISSMPDRAYAETFPRSIVILGSTGSIGTSALKVLDEQPEKFSVIGLAGARNVALLAQQAVQWRPAYLAVLTEDAANELRAALPADYSPEILVGGDGYAQMAQLDEASTVLSAQVGAAGLRATFAAAEAGKVIALANKESLVLAGDLIREVCQRTGAVLLPVDSEHNAIFQALSGHDESEVRRIILTASGGPFRGKGRGFLSTVTSKEALAHPNWSMGPKISIDSATLMNKGLEVIEAYHLYGVPLDTIEVVVHPQSIIHSLVEYNDGSQIAHMGPPDMRIAIGYCIGWPKIMKTGVAPLDLISCGDLTFEKPDILSFPCLELAREALRGGKGLGVVLNAANEIAVELFLKDNIQFLQIPELIQKAMEAHDMVTPASIEDIIALDSATRKRSLEWASAL
ncbi:1-deoxy-D-xylulose-5-phosphate reductoisomerase [Halodesulfovibrio spirochaetisodalis]|uniref:1-deoxy-D-xylulose 5-phosphate reductoisomerase n=1 Tax=Halodesulfovibrio spirochaetisodalis TaxID=1560234 RepID=A0A1B7XL40_9BACT|nr:1-deoxy-D-xylulose-5-phosphate reductoisomerase [Halodesulfovibrio spirochaetisodalis]OBQ56238.1 1-deoxy-D-xylulose 5-phosphate reductoisomerase [Halodesulfovibrio spirochaetisodalis]